MGTDSMLDLLTAPPLKGQHGPRCSFHKWLPQQSADVQAALAAIMAPTSGYEHADIARRLKLCGLDIAGQTVGRVRNGECKCPRGE